MIIGLSYISGVKLYDKRIVLYLRCPAISDISGVDLHLYDNRTILYFRF